MLNELLTVVSVSGPCCIKRRRINFDVGTIALAVPCCHRYIFKRAPSPASLIFRFLKLGLSGRPA